MSQTRRPAILWGVGGAVVFGGAAVAGFAADQREVGGLLLLVAAAWAFFHVRGALPSGTPAELPDSAKRFLERQVSFYRNLDEEARREFESRVAGFIARNRFVGVGTVKITEELKVLAASSAVMLLFGRPDISFPRIPEILFYANSFNEDFRTRGGGRDISGMNHPWGTIALSVPDLRRSFAAPTDGYHVGLHEFAHLLDLRGQDWDGIPTGMAPGEGRPWPELIAEEMELAREGKSALDPYAGTNVAEAFAVAVETFFERPEALRRGNPELFQALEDYLGIRPTERFKRRSGGASGGRRSPR